MKFKLPHHNKIITILENLNSEVLQEAKAYFGGGTLLSLDLGEYRLSKDIDFICPVSQEGYKYLRTMIFDGGYQALFHDQIQIGRATTDQYGIRMIIIVEDEPIKTEIIAEARFKVDLPRYPDWSPVPCLSLNDCFTSKLLANADRFMDNSVLARDIIDLAILRLASPIPIQAREKAENAYEVIRPLTIAIERFQQRENYRVQCFSNLQIDDSFIPKIIDGIDLLANDFNLDKTQRIFPEKHNDFYEFDNLC